MLFCLLCRCRITFHFENFPFSQINMTCEDTLMTPLHVAVKAQQIGSVVCLVDLDARLDIADMNGDTVFHYAATTTKDIIQVCIKLLFSMLSNISSFLLIFVYSQSVSFYSKKK